MFLSPWKNSGDPCSDRAFPHGIFTISPYNRSMSNNDRSLPSATAAATAAAAAPDDEAHAAEEAAMHIHLGNLENDESNVVSDALQSTKCTK